MNTSFPMTGVGQEYPADNPRIMANLLRRTEQFAGEDQAHAAIEEYITDRLAAIREHYPGPMAIMVGGGIDSLLLAEACGRLYPDSIAITIAPPGSREEKTARTIATASGLDWKCYFPTDITKCAKWVSAALGSADVWEVAAGVVLKEVFEHVPEGAVVAGVGADVLFLGGRGYIEPATWREEVIASINRHFTYHRAIPEFYERILGAQSHRVVKLWQTVAACDIALACTAEIVRGAGATADKHLLRSVALSRGFTSDMMPGEKAPMQESSGIIDALVAAARNDLARDQSHCAYTDPGQEPLELTVARLYLEGIKKWS